MIRGQTEPGAAIDLSLQVIPPFSGPFSYSARSRADKQGRYGFRVPYATSTADTQPSGTDPETSLEVRTASYYSIRSGERETRIAVSEEAVLRGEVISVPPLVALELWEAR